MPASISKSIKRAFDDFFKERSQEELTKMKRNLSLIKLTDEDYDTSTLEKEIEDYEMKLNWSKGRTRDNGPG